MMKYLQKLGKALMLPVAALPVCGILMGIGYALAPAVMGAEGPTSGAAYTVGFLLIKAGGALIDNMAWLFAIGAAVGLSDDHDGTAGLAGLVSFLMMQQLLSPGVVGAVRTLEEGTVDYIAFSKIAGNSFIGILAAIIGAACYNKFKNTQLPDWLAFFSGKRSVAIVTAVVSIVVSVVLLFVWPIIFGALVALGNGIAKMDAIGAGIYAFLNRLLIPTGLHHALNNVFWFDTIGLGDLSHYWAGDVTGQNGVTWDLGMYMSGFFPCMMFGIAGAALAMVQTAKNKKGDTDTVELMTRGSLVHKDGAYYIVYKETETTGYEGCTTTVKVAEDARKVSMLRFGKQSSQLIIEKGTRHLCHYETGYGSISLGVAADVIEQRLDENGGRLKFSYTLDSGAESFISRNLVDITVDKLPEA